MAEVVDFPGITKLDQPADRILTRALEADLRAVVVIGYRRDGEEYFKSSLADGGEVVWLMERMKKQLLEVFDRP